MVGASSILQPIGSPERSEPFQRLVLFKWAPGLVIICGGMLASFLIAGFWYPYWRIADMDMWMVYNALLLNDHLPQEFVDHPGYLPILLLSYWLRALHGLGIIQVDAFSALPPVSDVAGFTTVWTEATQAGRVQSLIFAMMFVVAFSYLLRSLVRDWRVAQLGGFMLAFSGGMAMMMRTLRTELLAAGFFTIALLSLLVVATKGERAWRPAIVGFASLLITLGMMCKIQIFFLICALPVLLLPFGPNSMRRGGFWDMPRRAWPALAVSAAIALVTAYLAKDIVIYGFSHTGTAPVHLPALMFGAKAYWPAMTVWLALGMIAYGLVWRVAPLETLAAMFAAIAGCMIGLLALYLRYLPNNVVVVFHPMEQLFAWATGSNPQFATGGSFLNAWRLEFLGNAIATVIKMRTFVLQSSPRPAIFLEWFIIAATIIATRRRNWRLVLQVAPLMLADWGVDTLGFARGLKQGYFIFTDPLAIVAAALLITGLTDLQRHRWAYRVGAALIAVHIVVSQAEPVKHIFSRQGPDVLCDQSMYPYYPRLGRFPFCGQQPASSQ